ncbi:MAG: TlpA family protein disulfide reductase [Oscillospiraceae bacterium]|nr:TlpA family protein disulfide reductase [Oscillospiraceae bacterium]
MRKKLKIIIQITAVIFIILFVSAANFSCNVNNTSNFSGASNAPSLSDNSSNPTQIEEKVAEGYMAPDISIDLLSGETVKLSDYRGKAVLLNFWASWCPPCVGEMPDIQKLSEAYPDDLVVIGVNCGEKKNTVDDFIKKNSYTFNIGIDENLKLQEKYPSTGIPYTVIIDPDGIVTAIQLGVDPKRDMYSVYEEYIKSALDYKQ